MGRNFCHFEQNFRTFFSKFSYECKSPWNVQKTFFYNQLGLKDSQKKFLKQFEFFYRKNFFNIFCHLTGLTTIVIWHVNKLKKINITKYTNELLCFIIFDLIWTLNSVLNTFVRIKSCHDYKFLSKFSIASPKVLLTPHNQLKKFRIYLTSHNNTLMV